MIRVTKGNEGIHDSRERVTQPHQLSSPTLRSTYAVMGRGLIRGKVKVIGLGPSWYGSFSRRSDVCYHNATRFLRP